MPRRPDYGPLRDAEQSGRDAPDPPIDNEKTPSVEPTRPSFNPYALQALRNMNGSFEGQQRLAESLIKAHAYDREQAQHQSQQETLDPQREVSGEGQGNALGHRADYRLLQKEHFDEREAALEATPDRPQDSFEQDLTATDLHESQECEAAREPENELPNQSAGEEPELEPEPTLADDLGEEKKPLQFFEDCHPGQDHDHDWEL